MEKTTHQNITLESIGQRTDNIFNDVACIRRLIREINQKANLTQFSYKVFLSLLDLKLINISQSILDISIDIDNANKEPTIDTEEPVTENDLPFV